MNDVVKRIVPVVTTLIGSATPLGPVAGSAAGNFAGNLITGKSVKDAALSAGLTAAGSAIGSALTSSTIGDTADLNVLDRTGLPVSAESGLAASVGSTGGNLSSALAQGANFLPISLSSQLVNANLGGVVGGFVGGSLADATKPEELPKVESDSGLPTFNLAQGGGSANVSLPTNSANISGGQVQPSAPQEEPLPEGVSFVDGVTDNDGINFSILVKDRNTGQQRRTTTTSTNNFSSKLARRQAGGFGL